MVQYTFCNNRFCNHITTDIESHLELQLQLPADGATLPHLVQSFFVDEVPTYSFVYVCA